MGILPQLLRVFIVSVFLLSAYAQNTTHENATITQGGICCDACKDPFDIFVLCAVPFAQTDDMTVYMNTSYYTPSQRHCLCKTRGFLRSAIDCFYCHKIDPIGWENWCTETAPDRSFSPGAIAGITVGVVALVMGVSYGLYRRSRIKKRAKAIAAPAYEQEEVGMKMELRKTSEVVRPLEPELLVELDAYEARAELPSH